MGVHDYQRILVALAAMLFAGPLVQGHCEPGAVEPRENEATPPGAATSESAQKHGLNLRDFGAIGDGKRDDYFAITKALLAAKQQGKPLYAPSGSYLHSDVLVLDGVELFGDGPHSVFLASRPDRSALFLKGKQPALRSVMLAVALGATERLETPESAMVCVWQAQGFRIDNVRIHQGASAGILNRGGHGSATEYAAITHCKIDGTLADGIHNTAGAHHVVIDSNRVSHSGDDGIAIVSYADDGLLCGNILIWQNSVNHVHGGRGISVVGGTRVSIVKNHVANTYAAGIYIMSEPGYETYGVSGVRIVDNHVSHACLPPCETDHPGILIGGRSGKSRALHQVEPVSNEVGDVTIRDNFIRMHHQLAIRIDAYSHDIDVSDNRLAESSDEGIRVARGARNVHVRHNTLIP
jgi:hypothetical protein